MQKKMYSIHDSKENLVCMETGIHTKNGYWIIVHYAKRFENDINYHPGWKKNFHHIDEAAGHLYKLAFRSVVLL